MNRIIVSLIICISVWSCKSTSSSSSFSSSGEILDYGSPSVEQVLVNNNTYLVEEISTDSTYGYSVENPIMVGGGSGSSQRRYLNALEGPNGEEISYERLGSCCFFKTENGLFEGTGLLDKYEVKYKGNRKGVILYINLYDSDVLKAPVGFTLKRF